jgi:hypothetical protein
MKIHGLFLYKEFSEIKHHHVLVSLETVDNQIDFNRLHVENSLEGDHFFEFRQVREVVFRDTVKLDEIKKFSICFTEKPDGTIESFAIALRRSGSCDFYYCLAKVATYERERDVDPS